MKILQVNTVVAYGSTGIICQNIARGLIAQGHDCLIVYGRGEDVADLPTKKIGNRLEQGLHYLQSKYLDRHGLGSRGATYQLLQIVKEYKPDIIHLHNIHGYYLNYKILFRELGKLEIPVVWLLHDQWAVSGGAAYIDENTDLADLKIRNVSRKPQEKRQYPSLARVSIGRFRKNLLDKYQAVSSLPSLTIVTPSEWLATFVKTSYLQDFPIKTIYNGMDSHHFTIQSLPRQDAILVLGAASVWDERKGLSYFCQLAEEMDDRFKIMLIGVDDSLPLPPKIIRLGKVTNEEMLRYYNQADIFLNPTMGDNFPSVNVEAQLCGTPVITFDTGGSKESICLETGAVVEKGNTRNLIETIQHFSHKTPRIAEQTRAHALQFSIEQMVARYVALYQTIVIERESQNGGAGST